MAPHCFSGYVFVCFFSERIFGFSLPGVLSSLTGSLKYKQRVKIHIHIIHCLRKKLSFGSFDFFH